MKQLLKSINPKQIFRLKKSRSVSKSAPPSFSLNSNYSSSTSSSDSSVRDSRSVTLPVRTRSDDCSDSSPATSPTSALNFDYVQAFKMLDRDNDGKITRVELESLLRRVVSTTIGAEEVEAMILEIDRDGDGCISLDELRTVGSAFESTALVEEHELKEAFDIFDSDHDGKITAEELHEVFVMLGDDRCTLADCRRMIESVDKNGDGFVCFQDFLLMMDNQQQQR